ncbi:hypothetical protein ACA910_000733 [Epithemia clementina (nom. ined.)]
MMLRKPIVVSSVLILCALAQYLATRSSSFVLEHRPWNSRGRSGIATRRFGDPSSNENDDDLKPQDPDSDTTCRPWFWDPKKIKSPSRRNVVGALTSSVVASSLSGVVVFPQSASATYKPAVRPLSYRVDSTIPPTLLSITPSQGESILAAIGRGSGTDKEAVLIDSINLNNMLNKAVFGAINSVSSLTSRDTQKKSKSWQASFCCLAMPSSTQPVDVALAQQVLQSLLRKSGGQGNTGLGLYFCPYSTQPVLDKYTRGELNDEKLQQMLLESGVSLETQQLYAPIFQYAQATKSLDLIAMAPEVEDMITVRSKGLQFVNPERRAQYVVDAPGFIALPQDPRYKLYTDRSLAKDFTPMATSTLTTGAAAAPVVLEDSFANFFSERILAHEAGATAVAQYAMSRVGGGGGKSSSSTMPLVTVLAPIADLRYLCGINGRIARICRALKPDCGVTDNAVTTILLNPTASDTLSRTRHLRLEIGTGPETLDYQTKVADFLWFSESPKVNLIPRLMN